MDQGCVIIDDSNKYQLLCISICFAFLWILSFLLAEFKNSALVLECCIDTILIFTCVFFFYFFGQSHDLFLWQHDFENSSSLTAHCCRKLCRRQPTLGAWLIHCSLSSHSRFYQGFPAWISDGDDCVGGGVVVKASNSMQRLVGGIHLILCVYYGVRPVLLPLCLPRQHPYTTVCCLCSRENISSAQGGED